MTDTQTETAAAPAKTKITVKDLVTLGIFTAIYVVATFIVAALGFVPILNLALPLLIPIVTGIPFMLYITRVKTFGLISIMGVIIGLVMFAIGEGWPPLVLSIVAGVAADLILTWGNYRSWPKTLLAFGVFSVWVLGTLVPFWVMRESALATVEEQMGAEYTAELALLTADWVLWLLLPALIVGTLIGGYLGRLVLRKHFVRAGIA